MANKKVTELTSLTTPSTDDLMVIVDDPAGTPTTKKISWTNILSSIAGAASFLTSLAAATQTLTNKTIDGDNNTISNLAHGSEVDNPSSGVHGVTGAVVGSSDSQTLTNKTIDGDDNTLTDLPAANLKIASQAAGDILYASSSSAWARLAKGSDGQGLVLASGIPSWVSLHGTNGWAAAGETWTYASASTFIVSGDVTAKYRKGTKLWFTQTSSKYAIVKSSSYSAPNTTVTIMVNTDYTIANAAITSPYYSYMDNPQAFPHWFNFTPTVAINGGGGFTPSWRKAHYSVRGGSCLLELTTNGHTISGTVSSLDIDVPINNGGETSTGYEQGISGYSQTSTQILRIVSVDADTIRLQPTSGNFATVAASGYLGFKFEYQI